MSWRTRRPLRRLGGRPKQLIWEGNVKLLEHEQRALVQPNFDRLSCPFARLFSIGSALSFEVRGVRQEVSYFTSFYLSSFGRGIPYVTVPSFGWRIVPTPTAPTTSRTCPSNALELALWLESDRMGFLLPALTQAKLDNQRDVVKNERRQRVDNVPYGQADGEACSRRSIRPDHPYHHSVIGSMADLSAASLEDVSAFFRTYYSPNNASLCIAGDFDPAEAKRLVEKYFGPIPEGPRSAKLSPSVPDPRRAEAHHDDRPRVAAAGRSWSGRPCRAGTPTSRRSTSWRRSSASSTRRTGSSGP